MKKHLDSLVVISVGVGMTVACGAWLYKPKHREVTAMLASAQAMRDQLTRGMAAVTKLSAVRNDVKQANELLTDYATKVPADAEIGSFIEEVSSAASRLRLHNRTIVPQRPEAHGDIAVLPIKISFDAPFETSFEFLRTVERLPRAVQVSEFSVKRKDSAKRKGNTTGLRTKMTLRIFYEAT